MNCQICGMSFKNKKALARHLNGIHRDFVVSMEKRIIELFSERVSIDDIYNILIRELNCPFNIDFIRKVLRRANVAEFGCPVCKKNFITSQARHSHIFRLSKRDLPHLDLFNKQLEIIKLNYKNIERLKKNKKYLFDTNFADLYLRTTDLYKFHCAGCGLNFSNKSNLTLHIALLLTKTNNIHANFIKQELENVDKYIAAGLTYEELDNKTVLPNKFINKYFSNKIAKTQCSICLRKFADNAGLGNHLKIHPEYVEKITKFVIECFDLEIPVDQIKKEFQIPFRESWFGEIWIEKFGREALDKRISKMNSLAMNEKYANGMKVWNEGKTAQNDPRIAKQRLKASKTKIKNNKSKGIYSGKNSMSTTDRFEFRWAKKVIKRIQNHTCQKCSSIISRGSVQIDAHHIIPFRLSRNSFISNLACLCSSCHNILEKRLNNIETGKMSFEEKCDLYIDGYENFINKEDINAQTL